jgi:hypothetical protein
VGSPPGAGGSPLIRADALRAGGAAVVALDSDVVLHVLHPGHLLDAVRIRVIERDGISLCIACVATAIDRIRITAISAHTWDRDSDQQSRPAPIDPPDPCAAGIGSQTRHAAEPHARSATA